MYGLGLHTWLARGGVDSARVLLIQQEALHLHPNRAMAALHRFLGIAPRRTRVHRRKLIRVPSPLLTPNASEALRIFYAPHVSSQCRGIFTNYRH